MQGRGRVEEESTPVIQTVDWVLSIKLASGWLSQAQLSWHEDNNNIKPLSLFITEKLLLNLDVHMIGSLASLFTSLTKPF